jgi:hypothetical protein
MRRAWLLAGLIVGSGTSAAAQCPPALETAKKIVLSAGEQYRREIARNADGTVDVMRKLPAQREPSTTTLLRGLIPVATKAPSVGTITYETDPAAIFPLVPGAKHTLPYRGKSDKGVEIEATMTVEVREAQKVEIAGCAFETIVVSRTVRFATGQRTPVFVEYYAPAVGFVVRAAMITSQGAIITNANETFDRIEVE